MTDKDSLEQTALLSLGIVSDLKSPRGGEVRPVYRKGVLFTSSFTLPQSATRAL